MSNIYTIQELEKALNKRQKDLCREYLLCGVKAKAMRKSGYAEKTILGKIKATFDNDKIQQYIKYLEGNENEILALSRTKILKKHIDIIDFDPKDIYDDDGNLIPPHKLPEHVRTCISGITIIPVKVGRKWVDKSTYKIKDSQKSLQELAKLKGYYAVEKSEIEVKEGNRDYSNYTPEEIKKIAEVEKAVLSRKRK